MRRTARLGMRQRLETSRSRPVAAGRTCAAASSRTGWRAGREATRRSRLSRGSGPRAHVSGRPRRQEPEPLRGAACLWSSENANSAARGEGRRTRESPIRSSSPSVTRPTRVLIPLMATPPCPSRSTTQFPIGVWSNAQWTSETLRSRSLAWQSAELPTRIRSSVTEQDEERIDRCERSRARLGRSEPSEAAAMPRWAPSGSRTPLTSRSR